MTLLQSSPYKKVLSLYSPLELVIADAPSVRNAFKFGFSDCKVEIGIKLSWIFLESVELVCEKLKRSVQSIFAMCACVFSWSDYLINVMRFGI